LAALALVALAACSEAPVTAPPNAGALQAGAVKFWEANAAVHWNDVAREMVIANRSPAPFAVRGYAVLSVAQYNAAVAAEKGKIGNDHPSVHAAIGGASVTALSYLYPAQASALEVLLEEFLAAPAWPGEQNADAAAGVAIGRTIGEQVVTRAASDNFFAPGTVEVPVGPCLWFSSSPPVGALWGQAKTFLLLSGDQFRPPPPPACDSPEFLAALAEVRQFSDTRTPAQAANAVFWDGAVGTHTPPGYWNQEAARLAVEYHLNERETAHMFALINMVSFDALVASHEAKYHYWLLRPTMADPLITLAIGLPNFPSYPSNHAAVSGGMARVLGHVFPTEKARLDGLAEEAALSRVLGGIHYRFDGDAGLVLGRQIAAWALAHDVRGPELFVLR
jgi:membrane-associated phospholipid phosphatase